MNSFPTLKSTKRFSLDLSKRKVKKYIALPPLARNSEGKIINESIYEKIVENGYDDVQEKIQSFHDEVDLYSVLNRCVKTNDFTLLNQREVVYGDYSDIPNDKLGAINFREKAVETFNALSDADKKVITDFFAGIKSNIDDTSKVGTTKEDKESA